ncbi:MAG: four helix bundle protein [Acidobacteria bacterium]|nr:four helix bundle protein [Acidobacteriota bacterium]
MRDFKRLVVWQRAYRLALSLHREADSFAGRHRFGVGDQLTRAATSISANVAEGAGRESVEEFKRFLTIAMGSAAELEHHLMLARDLQLVSAEVARDYLDETTEIQRMLYGLRSRVRF